MSKLRLGGASLNQHPFNWDNNLKNIKDAIRQAKDGDIDVLCLPELCITGYGCEDIFLGDWIYEKSLSCLEELIPECEDILVAIGLPIKYSGINHNATCIVHDKNILGIYVKQNMARDGVHYEPRWFIPWKPNKVEKIELFGEEYDIGDVTFDFKGAKMGFEICEDAWRQDRPACRLYEKGVNLILNPSASHFAFGKTVLREELVVSSSKNFKCTYVYANLLGNEAGRMIYDGEILIARHGQLINRNQWLSFEQVNLIYSDVDFDNPDERYPDPPTYDNSKENEFAQASALALFDYLRKSRSNGFVLSLSGGADSSSIAILVSEMVKRGIAELGVKEFIKKSGLNLTIDDAWDIEQVTKSIVGHIFSCAYQGTVNSSTSTLDSAKALAEDIGATFYHWNIDEEVESYTSKMEKALGRQLAWETDDITLQNIQARSRSPIIWMMANIKNALLLTTSNRSEGDVGYATMDGDTSGSIAPISAVDK
ncbi:MAG: nitrilase-related carbon-nitrogen hydrolase, partial [Bacteroidota bacterium]